LRHQTDQTRFGLDAVRRCFTMVCKVHIGALEEIEQASHRVTQIVEIDTVDFTFPCPIFQQTLSFRINPGVQRLFF
jgi:hypothetical protein